ncbi:hypothetical protein ACB098_04G043600 [Castanea mollissima]
MAPLKVLSALDSARKQFHHFKAIIMAGMGLFTDAYDLFCIPPIMQLIGRVYFEDEPESREYQIQPAVLSNFAIGQLVFGWFGDRIGRHKMYGLALIIMVLSSFGCGTSVCSTRNCVLVSLAIFRFILGFGIGGDYPLSATIMSEFANKRTRGAFIAAVFSMQGFGILPASTVTMVVCAIFDHVSHNVSKDPRPMAVDFAWRLILMLGAVPAGLTCYWRTTMPETARYTALVEQNVLQAAKDMEKVLDAPTNQFVEENPPPLHPPSYPPLSKQFFRRHGRDLFSCAASWFFVDIVFYSTNLFQSRIYNQYVPKADKVNAYQDAFNMAKLQAIVALCSTIPGYWVTVCFIDRIGRVKIQHIAIGIPYYIYWNDNTNIGFMILYGLTFCFSNFGRNTTTFIVPAELFPTRFRTTFHGISGAVGKVRAIIGSVGFLWASHDHKEEGYSKAIGMTASLVILGVVCITGLLVTTFFTRETMRRSLEENENDN